MPIRANRGEFPALLGDSARAARAYIGRARNREEGAAMNVSTWTKYVMMDDAQPEPGRLDAALQDVTALEAWDDDFEIGEPWEGEPAEDDA
jgi:hypothetical protein